MLAKIVTSSVLCAAAILILGCGQKTVTVEINDSAARQKYVEILDKNQFHYRIDQKNLIYVEANLDDLERKMQEFEEWQNTRLKQQGVKIIDP